MTAQHRKAIRQTGIYDGVLLVDKPSGPTSHDIVDKIKRKFRFDKVGHGGTLDPQATGLLVILIEKGTKLSNLFLVSDKTYEGTILLGSATDTQDAQGKTISEGDYSSVTKQILQEKMAEFTGDIMQTPPMVSAIKKNGVPLYKLARKGKTVERKSRLIHVYNFDILDFSLPQATFVLKCTKGTYVRTLCSDIGDQLGCFAHLSSLRRTEAGKSSVTDALPIDAILDMSHEQLLKHIIPIHKFAAERA
jgi:tRNA pseudouridine55 synthase